MSEQELRDLVCRLAEEGALAGARPRGSGAAPLRAAAAGRPRRRVGALGMQFHDTGYHDHDVSCGAVAVVAGELVEERLTIGGVPRRLTYRSGDRFTSTPRTCTGCTTRRRGWRSRSTPIAAAAGARRLRDRGRRHAAPADAGRRLRADAARLVVRARAGAPRSQPGRRTRHSTAPLRGVSVARRSASRDLRGPCNRFITGSDPHAPLQGQTPNAERRFRPGVSRATASSGP